MRRSMRYLGAGRTLHRLELPRVDPRVDLETVEVRLFDGLAGDRPAQAERELETVADVAVVGVVQTVLDRLRLGERLLAQRLDVLRVLVLLLLRSAGRRAAAAPGRRSRRAPGSRARASPGSVRTTLVAGVVQLTMIGRCVWLLMKNRSARPSGPLTSITSAVPCGASACPNSENVSGHASNDVANIPSVSFTKSCLSVATRALRGSGGGRPRTG